MADPGFLANPLLPATRSEMAVPIISGNRVLGVFDVQSTQVNGFSSEDVQIQSTLAAQIAVALENARSLERSKKAVEELDALTRRLTRESWEEFLVDLEHEDTEFVYNLGELTRVEKTGIDGQDAETAVSPQNGHLSQSLMVHGEAIGHLTAFSEEEAEQLGEDAALIMAAIAEQLSARVENIRLTEQTQQALAQTQNQAHRLGLLNEISAEMSSVETLNQVFDVIFARIPGLLNVDQVSMAMLQPDGETLEIIGHVGEATDQPTGASFPLADTPMAKALHDNRVIANNQPSSDNIIKSSMIAPIYSAGRAIGTLNIGSKKANALTNREESLLQQLATMLSSVIENKQLLAAAQARAERERQVRTITDKIRRGVDREAILNIAQQEIRNLLGANKSAAQLGTKTQLLERIQQTIEQTQQESG
jgi:GAF domain-containing protein